MTLATLPSRGIYVPTHLIFHPDLPPAVLRTWMQLRCLAWTGWTTPPMTVSELAAHLGIHTSRLYRHLAQLKDNSALSWHITTQGKFIISFPEEPAISRENGTDTRKPAGSAIPTAKDQETPATPSYFPDRILGYLSYQDDDPIFESIDEDLEHHEYLVETPKRELPREQSTAIDKHTYPAIQPAHHLTY
jgi:hypothetical protein